MGTEVLRPQDFLTERFGSGGPAVFPRRNRLSAGNPKPCRRSVARPESRRRSPTPTKPSVSRKLISDDSSKSSKNFVMGQVTILKRDLIVCGTERLGPDPEMVPKQIRIADLKAILSPVAVPSDVYAGAAFSCSPSPSSLPLPSFFKKKDGLTIVDDSATKDLRRLLRLD
ncbi:uncharacterized protein LOC122077465 [Macadamia integrifolia]|uniref:uncharacterized protein LOC122077465 n=1 Tax=Macadamia integrifolia TaxID=60698 RepID=UPI001C4FEC95|nr:uncharacterized protein LOC122077465 [Macadamia integrifolia]